MEYLFLLKRMQYAALVSKTKSIKLKVLNFDILHTDDIRVEHCDGSRRGVQQVLDACREERRPYLVIKEEGTKSIDISVTNDQTNQNSLDSWFFHPRPHYHARRRSV